MTQTNQIDQTTYNRRRGYHSPSYKVKKVGESRAGMDNSHAADLSLRHGLAMADAIVYATAKDQEAEVVTGDADLKNLPGVVYVK